MFVEALGSVLLRAGRRADAAALSRAATTLPDPTPGQLDGWLAYLTGPSKSLDDVVAALHGDRR